MSAPRKKIRVCIRLIQRQKDDNPELLEQVREALRQKNCILVVQSTPEDTCSLPNEQLETKAMKLAGAILDREERKVRESVEAAPEPKEEAKPEAEPKPEEPPVSAESRFKRLRKWIAKLGREGFKVVVEVLADKAIPPPGRGV